MSITPKIFGIGLHKTGTTTLEECLRILGFNLCPQVKSYALRELTVSREYIPCLSIAQRHTAFVDSPWNYPHIYHLLDVVFPGSRFILTCRNGEAWFRSLLRWVQRNNSAEWIDMLAIFGRPFRPEARRHLIDKYHEHNAKVRSYFSSPFCRSKLLTVDWAAGDGWPKPCSFLGIRRKPRCSMPHMLRYDEATDMYMNYSPRLGKTLFGD